VSSLSLSPENGFHKKNNCLKNRRCGEKAMESVYLFFRKRLFFAVAIGIQKKRIFFFRKEKTLSEKTL